MSGSQRTVLIQKGEGIADKIVTGFLCTIPEMKEKLEGGNIMINLGTLKEITDLRSIWPHEALNFTPWVAENVELLADAVGLDITVDETESSVGNFNVDIYASETGTDRKIIIENQLEDTDHDHLGKLITYASGKDADVVIWVVKHAREEHKAAVEWLNNHTDDKIGFFLCEIKLFQIGDSDIAPLFTVCLGSGAAPVGHISADTLSTLFPKGSSMTTASLQYRESSTAISCLPWKTPLTKSIPVIMKSGNNCVSRRKNLFWRLSGRGLTSKSPSGIPGWIKP